MPEPDAELHRFCNRLRILRSLSRPEVTGIGRLGTPGGWSDFVANPEYTFIRADDPTQAAIWAAIRKREVR